MTATRTLSTAAQIAKQVRADIKTAVKAGALGQLPDGVTFSVRCDNYAGGSSIYVAICNAPTDWTWTTWTTEDDGYGSNRRVITDAAQTLGDKLTAILAFRNAGDGWGTVAVDGATLGTTAPSHWRPGQD